MKQETTTKTSDDLAEYDKRVTAAAWDTTIFRDRKRPTYFFAPPQPGDYDFAKQLGVSFSPRSENFILIHPADDLEAT